MVGLHFIISYSLLPQDETCKKTVSTLRTNIRMNILKFFKFGGVNNTYPTLALIWFHSEAKHQSVGHLYAQASFLWKFCETFSGKTTIFPLPLLQ